MSILFSSTAAVYGIPVNNTITETDILKPVNPYGWSKLFDEQIIKYSLLIYILLINNCVNDFVSLKPISSGSFVLHMLQYVSNFKRKKIDFEIIEPQKRKTVKKSYADNFLK